MRKLIAHGCHKFAVEKRMFNQQLRPTRIRDKIMYEDYESESEFVGTYVHDVEGWSDDDIYDVLDGEPDAYWNID